MNGNLTEIVFILDRSGSMAGLEEDRPSKTIFVITTDGMEKDPDCQTMPDSLGLFKAEHLPKHGCSV